MLPLAFAATLLASCAPEVTVQDPRQDPVDAHRTTPSAQPRELGKVSWFRNEGHAQAASRRTGKPILMLFQEVPG